MKRYFLYTTEEVLALTNDDINTIIDYECALEGIPLLPPQPEPPPKPTFGPDMDWFTIRELSSSILFHCPNAVAEVIKLINDLHATSKRFLPGSDYSAYRLDDLDQLTIDKVPIYSEEHWSKCANAHKKYIEAKKIYDDHKAAYDRIVKDRAKTAQSVVDYINQVKQVASERLKLKDTFQRYLILADNNPEIAMNFLEKVADIPDDLRAEILGEVA